MTDNEHFPVGTVIADYKRQIAEFKQILESTRATRDRQYDRAQRAENENAKLRADIIGLRACLQRIYDDLSEEKKGRSELDGDLTMGAIRKILEREK